jgi:SAM-dependent methyltransferase
MRFDDSDLVASEYADEARFAARRVAFSDFVEGETAEDVAVEALREVAPSRVLEVGCGLGVFAARVSREVDAEVTAVDLSPRMVELTREREVNALVADVQELPFADGEFDCVVANWVLHHVPDLDAGLREIQRVLGPRGRLVAATFSAEHLRELYDWLGASDVGGDLEFSSENGAELLEPHFDSVERRDAHGIVRFPNRDSLRVYLSSLIRGSELAEGLPEFEGEFEARSRQSIFVATNA